MFVITKLDTSVIVVHEKIDYNADKTIALGLIYSDNSDVYSFLRPTCGKCTDSSFKASYLHDTRLGNTAFNGYVTVVKDNKGREIRHFFGVKRMGNLYLTCMFNFEEPMDFHKYRQYFDGLQIN